MKLKLAALVAGALLSTAASAQFDLGYELGASRFELADGPTKNRANNKINFGFQDERNGLGAEAVYTYTPKAKYGLGAGRFDQSAVGSKILAKAELPIAKRFSGVIKGGIGYQRNQIDNKATFVTTKTQEYFPTMAAGVNYKASDLLKVGVNINHDKRDAFTNKQNTYLSAGFNYTLDSSIFA